MGDRSSLIEGSTADTFSSWSLYHLTANFLQRIIWAQVKQHVSFLILIFKDLIIILFSGNSWLRFKIYHKPTILLYHKTKIFSRLKKMKTKIIIMKKKNQMLIFSLRNSIQQV